MKKLSSLQPTIDHFDSNGPTSDYTHWQDIKSLQPTKRPLGLTQKLSILVEEHIEDPNLSLDKVAKALHVSTMQLYRKVKSDSGLSPNQFIRTLRLQRGREMLLTSDWNIAEIAYAVGFNDPNYFTRSFTKAFKCAPSQYRNQALETSIIPV